MNKVNNSNVTNNSNNKLSRRTTSTKVLDFFNNIQNVIIIFILLTPFLTIHVFHSKYAPSLLTSVYKIGSNITLHNYMISNNNNTLTHVTKTTRRCSQTYFWGGGKSGSSSLYFMLANKKQSESSSSSSPFVKEGYNEVGKEPCISSTEEFIRWINNTKDVNACSVINGQQRHTHMLNGCPRHTTINEAKRILNLNNSSNTNNNDDVTFIMLIRDPIDRLVSHLNDECRRGGKRINIEYTALNIIQNFNKNKNSKSFSMYVRLSLQGLALKNLLSIIKNPKQILIIPMESLNSISNSQIVINEIMTFIGQSKNTRKWILNDIESNSYHLNIGNSSSSYNYITLSNSTRDLLREQVFKNDVLLLESLVGKQFSWSSWAHYDDNDGDKHIEMNTNDRNNDKEITFMKTVLCNKIFNRFCNNVNNEENWLVTAPKPKINITML